MGDPPVDERIQQDDPALVPAGAVDVPDRIAVDDDVGDILGEHPGRGEVLNGEPADRDVVGAGSLRVGGQVVSGAKGPAGAR